MKLTIALLLGALALLLAASFVILRLATPQPWTIPSGTLKVKKVAVDGQSYVLIEGEAMVFKLEWAPHRSYTTLGAEL